MDAAVAYRLKTLEQEVADLKAAPGGKGADGAKGDPGKDGADGQDGQRGAPGADGSAGDPGPSGDAGAQGDQGIQGDQGDPGAGDMEASTYDPGTVAGDAFDMDNMVEGTAKILTLTERNAISANSAKVGITPTQASDITANNAKVGVTTEEANVNADWDSSSGDSEILNKPTIPTSISAVATEIFEGPVQASQNMHGAKGTVSSIGWNPDTNNATYIDTYVDGDAEIPFVGAEEINISAAVYAMDNGVNNRTMYALRIRHVDSSDVLIRDYYCDQMYVRDNEDTYDSGGTGQLGGRMFVSAGDKLLIQIEVIDVATTTGTVYADTTRSTIKIDRITYVLS